MSSSKRGYCYLSADAIIVLSMIGHRACFGMKSVNVVRMRRDAPAVHYFHESDAEQCKSLKIVVLQACDWFTIRKLVQAAAQAGETFLISSWRDHIQSAH